MIISFTTFFAVAAGVLSGAVVLLAAALWVARSALGRSRAARATAETATTRVTELEHLLAGYAGQLETLLAERERERAAPTRPSLREAVALSRHGASTEELVATCRIGQSEARLIQMLYGALRPGADNGTNAGMHQA